MTQNASQNEVFLHWNYAHRGLHTEDKTVPENSLAAFRKAKEAGYGAELDVQLSKDGQVVVFHDDTLDRVTDRTGRVDAYDYEALQKTCIEGTEETIPLFTEVLSVFQGAGPLIVELKTGPKNAELCEKTYEILKTYPGKYCIESFNPLIVRWFKKNAPEIYRGQLACGVPEMMKSGVKKPLAWLLSRCALNFLTKPDFIAYDYYSVKPKSLIRALKKKGAPALFHWTVLSKEAEADSDGIIFQYYLPDKKF